MKNLLYLYFVSIIIFYSCEGKEAMEPDYKVLEMLEIPAGSFQIGSDKGYLANETPRVQTSLNSFLMSQYEITQHQYFTIMDETPRSENWGNYPIEQLSWYEAIKFCNELSAKENLEAAYTITSDTVIWNRAANGYRLPSEAEWEYACKAGTDTDFFNGDLVSIYPQTLDSLLNTIGWYSGNSNNSTKAVGQKLSNPFGLFDMHGNVWEWCWDYYNENRYIFMDDPSENPVDDNYSTERIIRGGSFYNDAFNARASLRYAENPEAQNVAIGFRVARNN